MTLADGIQGHYENLKSDKGIMLHASYIMSKHTKTKWSCGLYMLVRIHRSIYTHDTPLDASNEMRLIASVVY